MNNKIAYAHFRCIEEMFKGQPFGQHRAGNRRGDLAATPSKLAEHHHELLATRPIDVYVVGDVDADKAVHEVGRGACHGPRRRVERCSPLR